MVACYENKILRAREPCFAETRTIFKPQFSAPALKPRHQRAFLPVARRRIAPLVEMLLERGVVCVDVIALIFLRRGYALELLNELRERQNERGRLIAPLDFVIFQRIEFEFVVGDLFFDFGGGKRDQMWVFSPIVRFPLTRKTTFSPFPAFQLPLVVKSPPT